MQMTCPKCRGEMRQYERSGVVIDQCGECRGIFLDRGELEKLFDAEANWNQQHGGALQPAPSGAGYPPPPPPPGHGYAQPAYGHGQQHYGYHGHYRRKKKHGFLGELFD
ncbi:zf-TFIIB domain-containing protein [Micromonospora chalcea]|uniref:TFIIB-type zinc ribbon-containing protein n=1 Tax=Micromonospora chalcea TaxID=1874 RepID=UPI000CE4516A|nr:zf-TFIIB domain-containing protein [Micromonospora chalcea]PPA62010.1 hypothetical protein BAW75_07095 [Micromonospora chalcea]